MLNNQCQGFVSQGSSISSLSLFLHPFLLFISIKLVSYLKPKFYMGKNYRILKKVLGQNRSHLSAKNRGPERW